MHIFISNSIVLNCNFTKKVLRWQKLECCSVIPFTISSCILPLTISGNCMIPFIISGCGGQGCIIPFTISGGGGCIIPLTISSGILPLTISCGGHCIIPFTTSGGVVLSFIGCSVIPSCCRSCSVVNCRNCYTVGKWG